MSPLRSPEPNPAKLSLGEMSERATQGTRYPRQTHIERLAWLGNSPDRGQHSKIICERGAFYSGAADYEFVAACVNRVRELLTTEAGRAMLEGEG